jgi:hypothetical protein
MFKTFVVMFIAIVVALIFIYASYSNPFANASPSDLNLEVDCTCEPSTGDIVYHENCPEEITGYFNCMSTTTGHCGDKPGCTSEDPCEWTNFDFIAQTSCGAFQWKIVSQKTSPFGWKESGEISTYSHGLTTSCEAIGDYVSAPCDDKARIIAYASYNAIPDETWFPCFWVELTCEDCDG